MATTTLYVEVVIDHDDECDASDILDRVLDNGDLQDALVGYADGAGHTIEVTSALEVDPEDAVDAYHAPHRGSCGTVACRTAEERVREAQEATDDEIPLLNIDGDEAMCETEIVWDALGDVIDDDTRPESDEIHEWSNTELIDAYDWAIREACTDGSMQKRPRPPHTFSTFGERTIERADGQGPTVCCTCSTPLTEAERVHPRNCGDWDETCDTCAPKWIVEIKIEYTGGTRTSPGYARTVRGVRRFAYGGGTTPYGKAHDGEILWRAIIVGTSAMLASLGAVRAPDGSWSYTDRGNIIPCEERPAPTRSPR